MSEHYTLDELKALGEGTTPGPWQTTVDVNDGGTVVYGPREAGPHEHVAEGEIPIAVVAQGVGSRDGALIAAAPRLLAQATAQAEELGRLREALAVSDLVETCEGCRITTLETELRMDALGHVFCQQCADALWHSQ